MTTGPINIVRRASVLVVVAATSLAACGDRGDTLFSCDRLQGDGDADSVQIVCYEGVEYGISGVRIPNRLLREEITVTDHDEERFVNSEVDGRRIEGLSPQDAFAVRFERDLKPTRFELAWRFDTTEDADRYDALWERIGMVLDLDG